MKHRKYKNLCKHGKFLVILNILGDEIAPCSCPQGAANKTLQTHGGELPYSIISGLFSEELSLSLSGLFSEELSLQLTIISQR